MRVAFDGGGSHYVEMMAFTLAQLADQCHGNG